MGIQGKIMALCSECLQRETCFAVLFTFLLNVSILNQMSIKFSVWWKDWSMGSIMPDITFFLVQIPLLWIKIWRSMLFPDKKMRCLLDLKFSCWCLQWVVLWKVIGLNRITSQKMRLCKRNVFSPPWNHPVIERCFGFSGNRVRYDGMVMSFVNHIFPVPYSWCTEMMDIAPHQSMSYITRWQSVCSEGSRPE
jgi:hypothetical protein